MRNEAALTVSYPLSEIKRMIKEWAKHRIPPLLESLFDMQPKKNFVWNPQDVNVDFHCHLNGHLKPVGLSNSDICLGRRRNVMFDNMA